MGDAQTLATSEQVAAHLQIPQKTLEAWRYKGLGPRYSRVGKHVRYRWPDVEDWLRRQAVIGRTA